MEVGDLVRYTRKDPSYKWSYWTAVVVEKIIKKPLPANPIGSPTEYVRVVWQQDTTNTGLIRASLMEVVNENR